MFILIKNRPYVLLLQLAHILYVHTILSSFLLLFVCKLKKMDQFEQQSVISIAQHMAIFLVYEYVAMEDGIRFVHSAVFKI